MVKLEPGSSRTADIYLQQLPLSDRANLVYFSPSDPTVQPNMPLILRKISLFILACSCHSVSGANPDTKRGVAERAELLPRNPFEVVSGIDVHFEASD